MFALKIHMRSNEGNSERRHTCHSLSVSHGPLIDTAQAGWQGRESSQEFQQHQVEEWSQAASSASLLSASQMILCIHVTRDFVKIQQAWALWRSSFPIMSSIMRCYEPGEHTWSSRSLPVTSMLCARTAAAWASQYSSPLQVSDTVAHFRLLQCNSVTKSWALVSPEWDNSWKNCWSSYMLDLEPSFSNQTTFKDSLIKSSSQFSRDTKA